MKNIINNIVWFTRGFLLTMRSTTLIEFTKTVPGFGEMTCKAKNLKSCKAWKKVVPHCLFWDNVSVLLPDPWKTDEELQVLQNLYKTITDKSELIKKAIIDQIQDSKFLLNSSNVQMEIHLYDIDGYTRHPHVYISSEGSEGDSLYVAIVIDNDGVISVDLDSYTHTNIQIPCVSYT